MGISLTKMLGWALTDVAHTGVLLNDPRIDPGSPLLTGHADLGSYRAYLEQPAPDNLRRRSRRLNTFPDTADPSQAVRWDAEYGLGRVLCVRPLAFPDWSRRNNPIDWVEEEWIRPGALARGAEPRVDMLPAAPYPFTGWMDTRDGRLLGDDVMWWVRARYDLAAKPDDLDVYAQEAGFAGHADATARVAPVVPDQVRSLIEWGGLFTGPDVWLSLRPVLYTYLS